MDVKIYKKLFCNTTYKVIHYNYLYTYSVNNDYLCSMNKKRPKNLPGYITDEMYNDPNWGPIFDKALLLDRIEPIEREPCIILGADSLKQLKELFENGK